MKVKMVMKLEMSGEKDRSIALQLAAGRGIMSTSIDEKDNQKLIIVGMNVDPVKIARKIRKGKWRKIKGLACLLPCLSKKKIGMGKVDLVSVEEDKEEKKEEEKPKTESAAAISWPYYPRFEVLEIPTTTNQGWFW